MSKGEELVVDGSQGEGGGQILRTSLTLSMATGRPFRMDRIRAGRAKPGLLRQHLTAIRAARTIADAEVTGAEPGSATLSFRPGAVRPGAYAFAVGTAGSASLVLQTVLPALLRTGGESTVTVEGGTHNPAAPPFEFLASSFAPLMARLGAGLDVRLVRHGFYPAGGGCIEATIRPASEWRPMELIDRGAIRAKRMCVLLAHLPRHIGERELSVLERRLGAPTDEAQVQLVPGSQGPGNVVLVDIESEAVTEVFVGFGESGVRAEAVAERVARDVRQYPGGRRARGVAPGRSVAVAACARGRGAVQDAASLTTHAHQRGRDCRVHRRPD